MPAQRLLCELVTTSSQRPVFLQFLRGSSIGGPVFHPIDDYEHPLMYFPGTGIASHETAISGSFSEILLAHAIVSGFGG